MEKKEKRKSISAKIVFALGMLLIGVGFILTTFSTNIARSNLETIQKDSLESQAELMAAQIDQKLTGNLTYLEALARRPEFHDPEVSFEERCMICSDDANDGPYYTVLYTQLNGDTMLPRFGVTLNLIETHDEAFETVLATGQSNYKPTRTLNGTTMMVSNAVPVLDDGKVSAAIVATVLITDFGSLLGDDVEAFVVDPNGDYIGHTKALDFYKDADDEYVWTIEGEELQAVDGEGVNISINPIERAKTDSSYEELAALIQDMLDNEEGYVEYTSMLTGNPQYVAYATVASTGWKVAYLVDQENIRSQLGWMTHKESVVALIIILFGLLVVYLSSKLVLKPIERASNELDEMISAIVEGNGDLTRRIEVKTNDEIGRMVTGINKYTEVLQSVTVKIKEGTSELNDSVAKVLQSIADSTDQATDTSAIMEELAASMTVVDQTTTDIKTYMDEVVESVNGIYEEAERGFTFAGEVNSRALDLKKTSEQSQKETEGMINEISDSLKSSIENSKNVDKINDLTNDILNIASQTNLLALNASIEAARAGEAGKGFAVVADEIRQLADNSRETANNIQEISYMVNDAVNELVSNANQLLEYMNTNVSGDYENMVNTGEAYVGDATKVKEIMDVFQSQTDDIKAKISSALELLNSTTESISESAKGVSTVAENTTELVTSISQIDVEMENNLEVTTGLTSEVEKFKKV